MLWPTQSATVPVTGHGSLIPRSRWMKSARGTVEVPEALVAGRLSGCGAGAVATTEAAPAATAAGCCVSGSTLTSAGAEAAGAAEAAGCCPGSAVAAETAGAAEAPFAAGGAKPARALQTQRFWPHCPHPAHFSRTIFSGAVEGGGARGYAAQQKFSELGPKWLRMSRKLKKIVTGVGPGGGERA